jgi:alkylation response protein AidB-like acyl-CoA dehydrogenase
VDFNLDETQAELRTLAAQVLAREAAPARLEEHEKSGRPYDLGTWKTMAQAGLLGACLPEEAGGAGLGAVEMAVILREVGARAAPVPALPSLVCGLTIARYGTPAQKEALAPLAEGDDVLTFALREPGAGLTDPPAAVAHEGRGTARITGRTGVVPYAAQASAVLVPARLQGAVTSAVESAVGETGAGAAEGAAARAGQALFLVRPDPAAIRPMPLPTGEPGGVIILDGTPGEIVGEPDGRACDALRLNALAGITATASGVLASALTLTTGHIRTRRQFDRVLAEFQAVTMQIADVYIAARALDVTMWAGAWRLAQGLPAEADLAVAAYNAAGGALRALYTCQHLHGGIGLDVTYPLHRYFAWGKHAAHLLGGAQAQLDLIGAPV